MTLSPHAATVRRRLLSKLEEKDRRIAELELLLHLNEELPVRYATDVAHSKQITHIINALLSREMVSRYTLVTVTDSVSFESAFVYLCRTRQWLRKTFDIEIMNRHGVGWFLTTADKRKLRFALERDATMGSGSSISRHPQGAA